MRHRPDDAGASRRAARETTALRRLLERPTPEVAAALVGWQIARQGVDGAGARWSALGRIVETEAYLAQGDGASHSARGPTARNRAMFGPPGHAYVYLVYGMHHCLNVVTAAEGVGEAVLLRALEPLEGLAHLRARRGARVRDRDLCRGPGRLCQALSIDLACDGVALSAGDLRLLPPPSGAPPPRLAVGPRIGITKGAELPLRFREAGSPWTT